MPYMLAYRHSPRHEWVNLEDRVFSDGVLAGAEVKNLNQRSKQWGDTTRYRVMPLTDDDPLAWRVREEAKFASGEYTVCPWSAEYGYERWFDHVHPDDPTKVRFIENERDGQAGRYSTMSPGKFYLRYINSYPDKGVVEALCAKMGLDMTVSKMQLAITADEIENVYTSGPHSCMAYPANDDHFMGDGRHPVRAYAAGDLACAYITRGGDITARVMVWPEKKWYGRIYGDADRMKERLNEEGYTEEWKFIGAKLLLERNDEGQIVAPYVDGSLDGRLGDDHILLVDSDEATLILKSPDGIVEAESCQLCGAHGVHLSWNDDEELYTCDDHS